MATVQRSDPKSRGVGFDILRMMYNDVNYWQSDSCEVPANYTITKEEWLAQQQQH